MDPLIFAEVVLILPKWQNFAKSKETKVALMRWNHGHLLNALQKYNRNSSRPIKKSFFLYLNVLWFTADHFKYVRPTNILTLGENHYKTGLLFN